MTDISKTLATSIGSGASPTFFAADVLPPEADNPIVRLNLTADVAGAIADFGIGFMTNVMNALRDGAISEKPYDAASLTRDHEVDVIDLESDAELSATVEPFTKGTDARLYDKKRDGFRPFNLTAIAFPGAPRSNPVVLFKKQSQPSEIRSKRKIRIFSSKSQFDQIDGATFLFDEHFDAAYVFGNLLVFDKERFHLMFGYYDGLKKFVAQALPKLRSIVPIENFTELEAACAADKTLMKRLRRTMDAIPPNFNAKRFAAMIEKENIPIKIAGTKSKPTFVFEKSGRHDFFQLLEDGFLNSSATDRLYEANSKRVRGASK